MKSREEQQNMHKGEMGKKDKRQDLYIRSKFQMLMKVLKKYQPSLNFEIP